MAKANEQPRTSGSAVGWEQVEQNKQASGILAFRAAIQIRHSKLFLNIRAHNRRR